MEVKQKTSPAVVYLMSIYVLLISSVQAQNCRPTGYFRGSAPPPGKCNQANCCRDGQVYTTFQCSPQVTAQTKAKLSLKSFEAGGNGGGSLRCGKQMYSDDLPVVAVSTGWYDGGSRCEKYIKVSGNGRNVRAKVVDECDSTSGCDAAHDYQVPCGYNVVAASKAVWKSLGVPVFSCGQKLSLIGFC